MVAKRFRCLLTITLCTSESKAEAEEGQSKEFGSLEYRDVNSGPIGQVNRSYHCLSVKGWIKRG
jgi:hypothetical protein